MPAAFIPAPIVLLNGKNGTLLTLLSSSPVLAIPLPTTPPILRKLAEAAEWAIALPTLLAYEDPRIDWSSNVTLPSSSTVPLTFSGL